jgi:sugar-specific transcriptional regulator TrmB
MKCDKLKYEKLGDMMPFYPRSTLVIRKQFVDAAIDELKREHHRERDEYIDWVNKLQRENSELKAMVTTDNSAVIARLEDSLRKTQRALWLARASEASKEVNYWTTQDESSYAIVDFNVRHETIVSYKAPHHRPYKWILIWENVERKCLKKAEEYGDGTKMEIPR